MAKPDFSLKRRLVIMLLAVIAVTWSAIVAYSYFDIRHESEELLDAHLAQSAALILSQTDQGFEEIEIEHAPQFKENQRVAFQLWEHGRKLRLHSSNAPNNLFSGTMTGFSDVVIDGRGWRVFSAWTRDHKYLVQVAERDDSRHDITHAMTRNLLLPLTFALPLLGLLVWLTVSHALYPLARLGRDVARREADNLELLDLNGAPAEIMPLIDNLNSLFSRVEQLIAHERRFTADAAHELRTPLAVLMTQAQVARAATADAERNRALDNVITGCTRAARLVEQMLTLARLDPQNALGESAIFDLHILAKTVIADIAPSAFDRGVEIELGTSGETSVWGNSDLIRVALRNLVDNAVRYSPHGSTVQVTVSQADGNALVRVIDQGSGLSPDELKKVGQRFYRVLGTNVSGSGLGLSIARRITELHRGSLVLGTADSGHGLKAALSWPANTKSRD